MDNVGGCETFGAIRGVIAAIGYDGGDLVVEIVFRLICATRNMSMLPDVWAVKSTGSMV